MTTRPSAIVLEVSPADREELSMLLNGLGMEVWSTGSPVQARSRIRKFPDTDLAVIDWDMRHSEDRLDEPDARLVLEELARTAPYTLTVVYARHVLSLKASGAIQRAHPAAILLHDKVQRRALQRRLVELLSPHIGDLELEKRYRNNVRHIPTGRLYMHRAGFKLMTHHPQPLMVPREDRAMWAGMSRFRRWLRDVDSDVAVEALGRGTQRYRLVVRGREADPR